MRLSKCKYQVDIFNTRYAECNKYPDKKLVIYKPEICTQEGCKEFEKTQLTVVANKDKDN